MSGTRMKYDEEFKKNAVKMSYASSKSVRQIAIDLGIGEGVLYQWRRKYTAEGDKTRYATLEEENKALRLQLAEARIEADMLKIGTKAYLYALTTSQTSTSNLRIHITPSGILCGKVGKVL
jgi:transposase